MHPPYQAAYTRNPVESCIEAQYLLDSVLLHHSDVQSIASGKAAISLNDFPGSFRCCPIDGDDLIHEAQQGAKVSA